MMADFYTDETCLKGLEEWQKLCTAMPDAFIGVSAGRIVGCVRPPDGSVNQIAAFWTLLAVDTCACSRLK